MKRSKKLDIIEKLPKMANNVFLKILVKLRNLSNLANWIKKSLIFILFFFIVDGRKTIWQFLFCCGA